MYYFFLCLLTYVRQYVIYNYEKNEKGKTMKKRILSFLLAMIMVLTSVPLFAFPIYAAGEAVTEPKNESNETKNTEDTGAYNYNSLYVGYNNGAFENATFIMDFYSATTETEIIKGANYNSTGMTAGSRFKAEASTYEDFIVYATGDNYFTGGTTPISSPWSFYNYYSSNATYWKHQGGTATSGDGGSSYNSTKPAQPDIVEGWTDYYVTDGGMWAKATYPSSFGNGYFHMGLNSTLVFSSAVTAAQNAGNGNYTIQIISERVGSGTQNYFVGNRGSISKSADNKIKVAHTATAYFADTAEGTVEGYDIDNPNTFTFTFDRADKSNVTMGAYVNEKVAFEKKTTEKGVESSVKIYEAADAYIYAVRVYSKVLTADEIAQNHFADLAKYFALDVTGFDALNADEKKAVYAAVTGYTFISDKDELQEVVTRAITNGFKVTYNEAGDFIWAKAEGFTLPIATSNNASDKFIGYFADGAQVTDANGVMLAKVLQYV